MRVLVDTHVLLWWMEDRRERLSQRAIEAMTPPDASVVVSAATIWEIAIKCALGKLSVPTNLLANLERARVELLPITARHADRVATLPDHHRDPFDRLLVAQADLESIPLVSADESLRSYDVEVVW